VLFLVFPWRLAYRIVPKGTIRALQRIKLTKTVDVYDITHHPIRYADGLGLQKKLAERAIAAQSERKDSDATTKVGDLLILQHRPVYTVGTGTKPTSGPFSEYDSRGERLDFETVVVDRAGDITFHGPGQIVLYPVIDLVSL
jgi:lipoyl(octanoyl) transferase